MGWLRLRRRKPRIMVTSVHIVTVRSNFLSLKPGLSLAPVNLCQAEDRTDWIPTPQEHDKISFGNHLSTQTRQNNLGKY